MCICVCVCVCVCNEIYGRLLVFLETVVNIQGRAIGIPKYKSIGNDESPCGVPCIYPTPSHDKDVVQVQF